MATLQNRKIGFTLPSYTVDTDDFEKITSDWIDAIKESIRQEDGCNRIRHRLVEQTLEECDDDTFQFVYEFTYFYNIKEVL